MKGNILKLLEENIRLYLYDLREGKDLLNKISKEQTIRKRLTYSTTLNYRMGLSKTTVKKEKDKLLTGKKIFVTCIIDKGLALRNK